jgi:uncharacterized membrane protein YfhO
MNRSWITPDRFNASLVSVEQRDDVDRYKVLYKYHPDRDPRDLLITVPLNKAAYMFCRGVRKDIYSSGNKTIETNRYGTQFVLDSNNTYHNALSDMFEAIKERIEVLTNSTAKFPASVNPEQTKCTIYTNLIHSNNGKMYSVAYTEDKQELDIIDVGQCITRPLLLISIIRKSPKEVNIKLQVSEMLVQENVQKYALTTLD